MGLLEKIRSFAWGQAKPRISDGEIAAATVLPQDVSTECRYARTEGRELVQRYSGYVKVAASRNAAGVAACKVRVFIRTGSMATPKMAWMGQRMTRAAVRGIVKRAGYMAKRAINEGDGLIEITDEKHPVMRLVHDCNPRDNGYEVMESSQLGMELCGNGYLACERGAMNGWPIRMWALPPQWVRPIPNRERIIGAYAYGAQQDSNEDRWDASNVVHAKFPNPLGNPYLGMSPLAACIVEADASTAISQHQLASISNGMQIGGILSLPGASKETVRGVRAEMERQHQGPAKAGRVLVQNLKDATWMPWVVNEAEIRYLSSGDALMAKIAAVFDMPEALLTMKTAALAQSQEAINQWHTYGIIPRKRRWEDKFNEQLLPMFGGLGERLVIVIDDPDDSTMAERTAQARLLFGQGGADKLITANEARAMIDLEAIDGGDEFKAPPMPSPFGGAFLRTDEEGDPIDAGDKGTEAPTDDGTPTEPKEPTVTRAMRLPPRHGQISVEAAASKAVTKWFQAIAPEVMAQVNHGAAEVSIPIEGIRSALANALAPAQAAAALAGFNQEALASGGVSTISQIPERVAKVLEASRSRYIDSLQQSVGDSLTQSLADSIRAGDSTDQRTARIQQTLSHLTAKHAETVARTEAAQAYSHGRESAWEELGGVVEQKEWLYSGDPCEFCTAMNGRKAKVGEPFLKLGDTLIGTNGGRMKINYQPIMFPPLHPNCRCDIGAVFADDIEEEPS